MQKTLRVIWGVRIFDGIQIIPQNTVVVENGFITAVGEDIPPPEGAQVIDGSGQTLLPGLIDAHTHVWISRNRSDTSLTAQPPLSVHVLEYDRAILALLQHPHGIQAYLRGL